MRTHISRPQSRNNRIRAKNEFELCYIRHTYLRKVTFNPTQEDMAPYTKILEKITKNNYYTYKNMFDMVGMLLEDVLNIARVHLVSFLGLFALEQSAGKMDIFTKAFFKKNVSLPTPDDILSKNRAIFTMFLKQRMEDLVRICRQKAKNIKGLLTEEFLVFYGKNKPPEDLKDFVKNYRKNGYKKMDVGSFKSLKRRLNLNNNDTFVHDENYYFVVPIEHRNLTFLDFSGAGMNPYDSIHNMNPEEILFHKEQESIVESKTQEFNSGTVEQRLRTLRKFVRKMHNNPKFVSEVKTANQMIRRLVKKQEEQAEK